MDYPKYALVAVGEAGEFVVLYEGSHDIAETKMIAAQVKALEDGIECNIGILTWDEYMASINTRTLPKPDEKADRKPDSE